MIIRRERPEDYHEIYELVKAAFETAPVRDGDEQDYVNELRASEGYIPELAFVAEENGVLVGHIMFTTSRIVGDTATYEELLLSPLCVELAHRNRGVGAALIEEGFRAGQKMGCTAVFVVGDPLYYGRFGFRPVSEFGIVNSGNIPPQYIMARELVPDALKGKNGAISVV